MASFSEIIKTVKPYFDDKEQRQDQVLRLSREIVRLSARAIKDIHTGEKDELAHSLIELEAKVNEIKAVDDGFEHISAHCFQEYSEIKCLLAVFEQAELPDAKGLGIPAEAYLGGVADCVGEIRRSLQIALKNGDFAKAEYFFARMNDIYDNLMLLKYSSSIIGPLKQKQDAARSAIDHARSEMLMAKFAAR